MFSEELLERCAEIYDIKNEQRERFSGLELQAGRDLLRTSSREEAVEYHMGNLTSRNGSFHWANRVSDNKIKMMKHFLEQGDPNNLRVAIVERNLINNILETRSKDDRIYLFIKQEYDYWNNLDGDRLRDY